jgi:hypothetical protein
VRHESIGIWHQQTSSVALVCSLVPFLFAAQDSERKNCFEVGVDGVSDPTVLVSSPSLFALTDQNHVLLVLENHDNGDITYGAPSTSHCRIITSLAVDAITSVSLTGLATGIALNYDDDENSHKLQFKSAGARDAFLACLRPIWRSQFKAWPHPAC